MTNRTISRSKSVEIPHAITPPEEDEEAASEQLGVVVNNGVHDETRLSSILRRQRRLSNDTHVQFS